MSIFVIPDVHGMSDLLELALDEIHRRQSGGKIVFLGDYIDRGPDSVGVCRMAMNPADGWEHVCLMGNHEDMFLDEWLHSVDGVDSLWYDPDAAHHLLPHHDIIDWMSSLVKYHVHGPYLFAHAGADHTQKPEDMSDNYLMWRRVAPMEPYRGEHLLVHGHTIIDNGPLFAPNRLNLDCGAAKHGRLVVGVLSDDPVLNPPSYFEVKLPK